MIFIIALLISLVASIAGAICGIGGGVIIKPVLDSFGILSVATVNFLSGCTVLSMSAYSVLKYKKNQFKTISYRTLSALVIGSAIGGLVGKELFSYLSSIFASPNKIASIQAICLLLITIGTLVYTLYKHKIHTKQMVGSIRIIIIGFLLGLLSSFLGIGGGPINLIVLYYFFSMSTKEASLISLFIIFFSQLSSLIRTIWANNIPEVSIMLLFGMILCGIFGGYLGLKINIKLSDTQVQKLFILLMIIIIFINLFNIFKYI